MSEENLTLADVADIIMLEFCKEAGGLEVGSPYIEQAYRKAGVNLYGPTREQVAAAIENLAEIEKELFGHVRAEDNRQKRAEMLGKVK